MQADEQQEVRTKESRYRLDPKIHDSLMHGSKPAAAMPKTSALGLPDPVFPQYPERCGDVAPNPKYFPSNGHPYRTRINSNILRRSLRGWLYPYLRSRLLPGEFHPIIAFLFTDYKCNLECHYCWAYDNRVPGMTEEMARSSIDWLHDTGCRVLALMGGEVLIRPKFIHKIAYYAAKKGFWIYVPTNGRLMRPEVIDWLGDAGIATVNLGVDSVEDRPELPKALNPIFPYFNYLIKKQYLYDFSVFFNINITRINIDDVKRLTEIARDNGIATDYHINESPMLDQPHFKHNSGNSTFITEEDWPRIDELVDWIIEKNKSGYKMVNSVRRLEEMKAFMRGKLLDWNCRAGQNSVIIRTDGTLAPCFPMYSATQDWGGVGQPRFDFEQLKQIKRDCQPHCFSTLNHNLAYCYEAGRAIRWTIKQALRGFRGTSGSFED
ncbi:MAG: radical SAM protein [Acidobacteria bacterium]|nr:radical SAM protein [Acidobacteriota bacterium]